MISPVPLIVRHVAHPDGTLTLQCRHGGRLPGFAQVLQYLHNCFAEGITNYDTLSSSEMLGTMHILPVRLH